ncbi:hypothetical protein GCM10010922_23170 [Microbacterium sorbitolivorans]|uniref:ATP synthase protein I n=1 Tax=Microbacterium sorbitolivorans TaxID=1867410 RepID=A0A367XTZ1_9MICO|nr:hypothetical protein [Microbacterium sorbitolivorans]RCK57087.1 hypothetical protein DTO57_12300 [Microbacterium sorbitolivorans]GGF46779.1 hypothetical protein GCM10010922_23170 [Microbacterium sorbitolivorans]
MFRNPVVLRTVATSALAWTGASLVACLAAFFVAGLPGLGSAAVAAGAGLVFPILTVLAIAVPDRGYGSAPYAARVFFGFLVGFVLKVALFFVALLILLDVVEVVGGAAYGALLATALVSLAIDVFVANGIRSPADERLARESS